jgi:N-acetylmuramoyl-L-alanine amidase
VVVLALLAGCGAGTVGPAAELARQAPPGAPADVVADAEAEAVPADLPPELTPEEQARAEAIDAGLDPEARVVVTPAGIVAPVLGIEGDRYRVRTPCAGEATVAGGTPIRSATVVLDPGHGGSESGAVGPNGLTETELNLIVTERARLVLEGGGIDVVQTRYVDHQMTLQTRAEIANALGAPAFVSIHHNGGPDNTYDRPGTEMYHQIASPESRRLAGLLQEELFAYFSQFEGIEWHGNVDAGAKWRPNRDGGDYYGILRRSEVPAVISEGLFLSSSLAEAELLARPDVQEGNGDAIARAIARYLTTDDPGSGFVEPIQRDLGSGAGGSGRPCEDPPLE